MRNRGDGLESAGVGGGSPEAATLEVASPAVGERPEKAGKKNKRKAARLRSVWIAFTGRILAQFVGSAASILLGLSLIHNYTSPSQGTPNPAVAPDPGRYQGRVARTGEAGTRRRQSIVVLPIDDYSGAGSGDRFAPALTEFVTASLAERGSLAVLSRTSASRVDARRGSVPEIARRMGVDLVLEASVTRDANRIRVVAQLIDGRSDEHLWARSYDREVGDVLRLQAEIAGEIASGIDAALDGTAPRPSGAAGREAGAPDGADSAAGARVDVQAQPLARLLHD